MNNHRIQFQGRLEKSRYRYGKPGKKTIDNHFECAHCQGFVFTEPGFSGVLNRNHCPYCLWSRHMDLYAAGDRLSACKEMMRPIGLTIKAIRKKYPAGGGELMLIHQCGSCGRFSINRVAADDDPQTVFSLFESSLHPGPAIRESLDAEGIRILNASDRTTVRIQLLGNQVKTDGFYL
jgi:hypothetical protein